MRFFGAVAALIACTSALPNPKSGPSEDCTCLTKQDAHELVNNFIQLSNGDAFNVTLARDILTRDVVDTSGSVASIINAGI